jgi:hypothetical protein
MTSAPGSRQPARLAGPRGGDRTVARRRTGVVAGCCVAALAAAGCVSQAAQPASHPSRHSTRAVTAQVSRADLKILAARYLVIARPANHRLDVEVDGYGDAEHDDLATAEKDLREETATERQFDAELLRIRFPSWIAMTAQALVRANDRRIALTERQARSASLASLRSDDHRHEAADAAVETQARQIRLFLGLPPPATS